ncbi:MAG: hypothetical protein CL949_17600 [Erythrobacter sp.]|nr:hypothetical protein [Erythrobacter sp.]MAM40267.1 hypothetical protein [Erythrobacter sp.]|tara:strand:- start:515 stop:697 length:183 start_codon:yes stop_codon:yes gene_type:complete
MSTMKKAKVLRNFNDAGTNKRYAAGEAIDLTDGEFTNYAAAGLVEAATGAADAKADTKKA